MSKPSQTNVISRCVISVHCVIALKQQIALLMDTSKYLKDLHCSSSLRETVQLLALSVDSQ